MRSPRNFASPSALLFDQCADYACSCRKADLRRLNSPCLHGLWEWEEFHQALLWTICTSARGGEEFGTILLCFCKTLVESNLLYGIHHDFGLNHLWIKFRSPKSWEVFLCVHVLPLSTRSMTNTSKASLISRLQFMAYDCGRQSDTGPTFVGLRERASQWASERRETVRVSLHSGQSYQQKHSCIPFCDFLAELKVCVANRDNFRFVATRSTFWIRLWCDTFTPAFVIFFTRDVTSDLWHFLWLVVNSCDLLWLLVTTSCDLWLLLLLYLWLLVNSCDYWSATVLAHNAQIPIFVSQCGNS